MTEAVVEVSPQAAPTAGQRVARGAGHSGGVLIVIELWQAFEWFGADGWTADEAAARWPAVTAAAIFAVVVVHNIINWLKERQTRTVARAVTVEASTAEAPDEPDDWHHRQLRSQLERAHQPTPSPGHSPAPDPEEA